MSFLNDPPPLDGGQHVTGMDALFRSLKSAAVIHMIASQEASYYSKLVEDGVDPETAQALTAAAMHALVTNGVAVLDAAVSLAATLAPLLDAVLRATENPLVRQTFNLDASE